MFLLVISLFSFLLGFAFFKDKFSELSLFYMLYLCPHQSFSTMLCRKESCSSGLEKVVVYDHHTFILDVRVCVGQCSVLHNIAGRVFSYILILNIGPFLCMHSCVSLKCFLVEHKNKRPHILSRFLCMADRIKSCILHSTGSWLIHSCD